MCWPTEGDPYFSGSTLEETCQLAEGYPNLVPVMSSGGHLALLDPSAPFLFRGRRRYYRSEMHLTHRSCQPQLLWLLAVWGLHPIITQVPLDSSGFYQHHGPEGGTMCILQSNHFHSLLFLQFRMQNLPLIWDVADITFKKCFPHRIRLRLLEFIQTHFAFWNWF